MHLVIFGPEGSGKGTQATLLGERLALPIYTSGDLVRDAASSGTGKIADICRNALSAGTYVPDSVMFSLWQDRLKTQKAKKGFIIDGFPRNENQAKFLVETAKDNDYDLDRVIYIRLSDQEATKRLLLRNRKMFAGETVSHDTAERIAKRLTTFRALEQQLVSFFEKMGILLAINGQQSVEDVHKDIMEKLTRHDTS